MTVGQVQVPAEAVADFCRRWGVAELSLFGSALRDDFRPDSDVDLLVHFHPGRGITFENMCPMRDEASAMFGGREVDLIDKQLLRNPFVRYDVLTTRQVIYATREGRPRPAVRHP